MAEWFVRAELDAAATDAQAEALAQRIGSTFVDRSRGRTEVSSYVSAVSARQAISEGLEQIFVAAMAIGLDANVVQLEVKTEKDRVSELVSRGVPEMVGVAEIQEILHVNTRQQVSQLAERNDFPKPVAELRAGRIWLRADIDSFKQRWRRTPGRAATT